MTRNILYVVMTMLIALLGYLSLRPNAPGSVTVLFDATINGEPVVFGDYRYANPGGSGTFKINDFRFYLSDLELSGGGATWAKPDSYHLVRFDNESRSFQITLTDVPLTQVETVVFAIGIDEATNTSLRVVGDLDPNNRMAWNWSIGYKFLLLEGALKTDANDLVIPLVYHVGFSENRRQSMFSFSSPIAIGEDTEISFDVNPMKLFFGTPNLDISQLSSVKFDKVSAAILANNFMAMFTLIE